MNLITQNQQKLNQLCLQYNVQQLYLFGSVLTDKFNENSDIDMLIQFSAIDLEKYFDNYMDFKENVEKLFNRKIDLVENQAIKNPIFRKIVDRDKKLIYG